MNDFPNKPFINYKFYMFYESQGCVAKGFSWVECSTPSRSYEKSAKGGRAPLVLKRPVGGPVQLGIFTLEIFTLQLNKHAYVD